MMPEPTAMELAAGLALGLSAVLLFAIAVSLRQTLSDLEDMVATSEEVDD